MVRLSWRTAVLVLATATVTVAGGQSTGTMVTLKASPSEIIRGDSTTLARVSTAGQQASDNAGVMVAPAGGYETDNLGTEAGQQATGPDGVTYVWVPAGEFILGPDYDGHSVSARITRGFWIGLHEVTNAQYARFLNAHGSNADDEAHQLLYLGKDLCHIEVVGGVYAPKAGMELAPVQFLTWYGAKAYCDHHGLSLPTEAEWEYAASGPQNLIFSWGNDWNWGWNWDGIETRCCNWRNQGHGGPYPVGSFPQGRSWCGALDMTGNVWEWCNDYLGDYPEPGPIDDPQGPDARPQRVLRGGGWWDEVPGYATHTRYPYTSRYGFADFGFRSVMRVPVGPQSRQPDLLIHDGSGDLGDGVYNTTGASQTHAQTAPRSSTATYLVKLQNDGNMPDSITVAGPAGDANWTVRYLDAMARDISADVTGAGYSTGARGPGAEVRLQIKVTPRSGAGPNATRDVLLTATSGGDGARTDAVLAKTTCAPSYRPDAMVYDGSAYLGDNVYNTSGVGQTHSASVLTGSTAVYHIRVYNDGEAADSFRITGPVGSSAWRLRYYDYATGTDITGAVTGAGWVTTAVSPRLYWRLRVEVTPLLAAAGDSCFGAPITATSLGDETRRDGVMATTTCLTSYRPDGLIYSGSAYLGDNVYNTSGVGQTHSLSAPFASPAVYHIRFYNDGNVADSFRVTGPGGNSAWRVRYYDYATGMEITSAVTGAGQVSAPVGPRLYWRLLGEVTPLIAARINSSFTAAITATSVGDATRKDTVRASTTCLRTYRPDGLIYNGSAYQGDDVYNTSGTNQQHSILTATGRAAAYHIRFYNDGNVADGFRITGPAGGSAWKVRYYDYATGTDITGAVTGAGWGTPAVSPRLYWRLRVEVTPLLAAGGNTVFAALIKATSRGNGTSRDVVKAVTTCLPTYRPDAMIHNGTVYVGDNIFNTTGVAQYRAQTVAPNVTATFHIRLYNDGNVAQRLAVTGPAGDARWDVQFLDHATGTDITSAVAAAGWQTPLLPPGGYRQVTVLVTPTGSALPGETLDVVVRASSLVETTCVDAVLARTTRY